MPQLPASRGAFAASQPRDLNSGHPQILAASRRCRQPLAQQVLELVTSAIERNSLTLPTLPDVALAVGHTIGREQADASGVAREIARDPGIAAGLLRVANCAAIAGSGRKVDNLAFAVARLGFARTRVVVNRLAMAQMFQARNPALKESLRNTWNRSLEVAALSKVLASHCTRLNADTATLAGLVHLVGVLPIATVLDQQKNLGQALNMEELSAAIDELHPHVGHLVLDAWGFPQELLCVPAQAFDFRRRHGGDADYADVVSVAILQLHAVYEEARIPHNREEIPALEKMGLGPEVEVLDIPGLLEDHGECLQQLAA